MKLILNWIRAAKSRPQRIAALNHELWNHAMEDETVVKRAPDAPSGFGIRK